MTTSHPDSPEIVEEISTSPGVPSELQEDSDARIQTCLHDAEELKKEGTEHFRAGSWAQALASYRAALGRLPKRARVENPTVEGMDLEPGESSDPPDEATAPEREPLTGVALECAKARAVLNANIGACHVKLDEHKDAVAACTEALVDDPGYLKAIQRRAASNEKIATWSALGSAQEDYTTLLKILPPDSPQIRPTKRALEALKPRVEAAQKKETAEMMDKLKGFGNSILGNFGLSTDNFQFQPNGQGGYSMNFVR